MAKVWIIGDFLTGITSETNILPVVRGSDSITKDINSEDFATLRVSKNDLPNPADWKAFFKPGGRLIAAVDTDKAWNAEDGVLFAGFVKEVKASAGEAISLQVAGFREYASNRIISTIGSGVATDPKAFKEFNASTWANVLNKIASELWVTTGLPTSSPKPPTATKGTVGSVAGSGLKAEILNTSTMKYSDALDYVRDELSSVGEEYQFVARWENSAKGRIVFDFKVGTASAPQLNKTNTFNVNLDAENYTLGLANSLSMTDHATRLIAISTQTEEATDYKMYDTATSSDLLIDDVFNPGVELTPAQLDTFTSERLASQRKLQEEGEILVVSTGDPTWLTRVGSKVNVTGGAGNPTLSGMNLAMRLVRVNFSLSSTKVTTTILMDKARYGKLPDSPTNPSRLGSNPSMSSSGPIMPKLPDNQPLPGGGGGGFIPMPPDFGKDIIPKPTSAVNRSVSSWSTSDPMFHTWCISGSGKYVYKISRSSNLYELGNGSVEPGNTARNVESVAGSGVASDWNDLNIFFISLNFTPNIPTVTGLPDSIATVPGSWISARSKAEDPSILKSWINGTLIGNIYTPIEMVASKVFAKSLKVDAFASRKKMFIHFVETLSYGNPNVQPTALQKIAGDYVHGFTGSFDINEEDGSLSNWKEETPFGSGVLSSDENWTCVPECGTMDYDGEEGFTFHNAVISFGGRWGNVSSGGWVPIEADFPLVLGNNVARAGGLNQISARDVLSPSTYEDYKFIASNISLNFKRGEYSDLSNEIDLEEHIKYNREEISTTPTLTNRPSTVVMSQISGKTFTKKEDPIPPFTVVSAFGGHVAISPFQGTGKPQDSYSTMSYNAKSPISVRKKDSFGWYDVLAETDTVTNLVKISEEQVYLYSGGWKRLTPGRELKVASELNYTAAISPIGFLQGRYFLNPAEGYFIIATGVRNVVIFYPTP